MTEESGESDEIEDALRRGISGETSQAASESALENITAAAKARQERDAASYSDPFQYPTAKFDPEKAEAPLGRYREANSRKRGIPLWIRAFFRNERGVHEESIRVFEQLIRSNGQLRKDLDRLYKRTAKLERKLEWFEEMIDETRMDTAEFKTDLSQEIESIQAETADQLAEIEVASYQLFKRLDQLTDTEGGA